jgi:GTP-binding protein
MPVPRVAIVGRPNVGKSSLLNMLAHDKVSIVDPTPGTTRDRVSLLVDLTHSHQPTPDRGGIVRTIELTDTGGYGVYVAEGRRFDDVGSDLTRLTKDIEHQISEAVGSADLVLFVIDAQAGVTPADEQIARMLRERVLGGRERGDLRVLVVANKTDGPRWEAHAFEAASLGFGEPLPVSARNNYFRRDFTDALYDAVAALPGQEEWTARQSAEARAAASGEMRLAIIGKRNAGKSSLVNALAGEQRVIVSEIAGTTRDAVDVRFEMDGHSFVAIDTAGLRKKKSFADRIEWFAFDRAQRSIERADVVFLLVDATVPVSQVDQQLAQLAQKSFKPVIIVVNKWDLVEGTIATDGPNRGRAVTTGMFEDYLRKELAGLWYAPIAFVSAHKGSNLRQTVKLAQELFEQSGRRVNTGKLNRVLRDILATRGPSSKLGTFAKAYFIAQVAVRPPTIVLVVNTPRLFTANYQKFLVNRLREELDLPEVPIKLIIRERKRADLDDLLSGRHAAERAAALGQEAESPGQDEAALLEEFGTSIDGPGEAIDLDEPIDADALPEDAEAYFDDKA